MIKKRIIYEKSVVSTSTLKVFQNKLLMQIIGQVLDDTYLRTQ